MLEPRGIRNNNPGNIRHGSSRWQGMKAQQTDPEYVQFINAEYGIRAMAKLLQNYQNNYGLRTIREIITRWAPPNENATESYIESVSAQMRWPESEPVNLTNSAMLAEMVRAVIHHENGKNPYTDTQILTGVRMI